jgi:hypothetical protein
MLETPDPDLSHMGDCSSPGKLGLQLYLSCVERYAYLGGNRHNEEKKAADIHSDKWLRSCREGEHKKVQVRLRSGEW